MITKANVIRELTARSEAAALGVPSSGPRPSFVDLGGPRVLRALWSRLAGWSDARLALLASVVLFCVSAWPLLLVDVPPLQDLPNHLAAITVIQHPERYPEFVFNGFFKTNTALFAWLYFVGNVVGLKLAARLFVVLVLAANALVFPRAVLELTGSRRRMIVSTLFVWPFVHNWFVSMGMLDYALGVPMSLFLLLLLARQKTEWRWGRAAGIAVLAVATWYAHVFTLMVVHLLVGLEAIAQRTWRERARGLALFAPMAPATVLVAVSLYKHMTEPGGAMHGFVSLAQQNPAWELAYNLWAEWLWGFTKLSITSIVAGAALLVCAWIGRRQRPTFFGPWAMVALLVLYALTPYIATNWFHVNSRLIPYIWVAALLRVPERLDRRVATGLGACAVLYSVGMGIDYQRVARDQEQFTAGIAAVPKGAHLLPLLFHHKVTSENTASLLHAWGYYVVEKETDAPLLFAHSASFPVMYREPPPARFNHLVLQNFAPHMADANWICGVLRAGGVVVDCDKAWRRAWADFWTEAMPRYDTVLLWDASPGALALMPSAYHVTFRQGRLIIAARDPIADEHPISAR